MVKNPPSIRALTTGLVSCRIASCSSEAAAIRGMRSRAFCSCGWTVGMVCLLLREKRGPRLNTNGPGALVKRWRRRTKIRTRPSPHRKHIRGSGEGEHGGMPKVRANDVELYYEETGSGFPVIFCHEFAGDRRSW